MTKLELLDQAAFLRLRATGQGSVCQCTWVYDRDVALDELEIFNRHLRTGLLGRRIERSPLPFGRHRWVADTSSPDIDVAERRSRADIGAWIQRRGRLAVDPEWGPTFHLAVLPLDDGGAAVTLVASHCVADGLGLATAIAEAVKGESRNFGYPQADSRAWWLTVSEDLAEAVRALPAVIHALVATLLIVLRLSPPAHRAMPRPRAAADDEALLPSVTVQTDTAAWDARACDLGGSSNTLFVAFAARLATRAGRVAPDGHTVTVVLPVSERGTDDTRANALTSITVAVNGETVTDDLSGPRAAVKAGLTSLAHQPNEMLAGLPLVPFTPRWLVRRTEGVAMASGRLPVGCSNLGAFDAIVGRIDGADASEVSMRLDEQGITRHGVERTGGQLFCGTGTINGSRFLTVSAHQIGAQNTAASTRDLAHGALADLKLSATNVH